MSDLGNVYTVQGEKLPVGMYAKLRDMSPQRINYHIQEGHIQQETCICGARVIDVKKVDEYFTKLDASKKDST